MLHACLLLNQFGFELSSETAFKPGTSISCLLSLIIIRIIQNKVVTFSNPKVENKWAMGLSGTRIQKALNKWTVSEITNGYYRFNDIDDLDLKLILDSFNINIPIKLFKKMELHNIKTSIKVI